MEPTAAGGGGCVVLTSATSLAATALPCWGGRGKGVLLSFLCSLLLWLLLVVRRAFSKPFHNRSSLRAQGGGGGVSKREKGGEGLRQEGGWAVWGVARGEDGNTHGAVLDPCPRVGATPVCQVPINPRLAGPAAALLLFLVGPLWIVGAPVHRSLGRQSWRRRRRQRWRWRWWHGFHRPESCTRHRRCAREIGRFTVASQGGKSKGKKRRPCSHRIG